MTWRELRTFVRRIPQDSAYGREVLGEAADWGIAEHLQAIAINDQRLVNSGKKSLPESRQVKPPPAKTKAAPKPERPAGGFAELDALFTGGDG